MKDFISLQPQELQDVYYLYKDLLVKHNQSQSQSQEIINSLSSELALRYNFTPEASASTAEILYTKFSSPSFAPSFAETSDQKDTIVISSLDYELFIQKTLDDPDVTPQIKSLLLAFIVYYRQNEHPSGWIKYDRKTVFYLAGLNKISVSQQESLTKYLHTRYNLCMRVVGSNQPIPCFNIDWVTDQPPLGSSQNPSIPLGPLSPNTIQIIVSSSSSSLPDDNSKF